ncbi:MAG: DNA-3-methyladenine glycosylase 2 family protein [Nocardioides sp.]|uniref:DNA-3-methyladenine glycosylase family protein n=1 Tax=Nocardioides sp. TaxID=35761 RepID=UPI0039E2F6F0
MPPLGRVWRLPDGCEPGVMRLHQRGGGDPAYRIEDGRHWRGIRTPHGPATLVVWSRAALGEVHAEAWGPGAAWALGSVPGLLGADDDPAGFEPRHPLLIELVRRHGVPRVGRTERVMEALVPVVIEQKVTGREAFAGFRALVHRFGERAPGPGADRRLWIQPDAETVRRVPSWEWLRMSVDPARGRTVVTAARVAPALERTLAVEFDEAAARLTSLPGVGRWTAAETLQRAHGDPDAVSFGDYHVAKDIGWALTGEPFDDERLEEFLEPYRPHRGRVQALVARAGLRRPRRGPRMPPRTHLPATPR